MVWGTGSLKSCKGLLQRVEQNDSRLSELVILPMKTFGDSEMDQLSQILSRQYAADQKNRPCFHLHSLQASGHAISPQCLGRFAQALGCLHESLTEDKVAGGLVHVAIGDSDMGDKGVVAFCQPLQSCQGGSIQSLDLAWKGMSLDGSEAIGKTFGRSEALKTLTLSRNEKIGGLGIKRMFSAAAAAATDEETTTEGAMDNSTFPVLETLILSQVMLDDQGLDALCQAGHFPLLQSLCLSDNPHLGPDAGSLLSQFWTSSPCSLRLHSLSLARCSLGNGGIDKLLSGLEQNGAVCKNLARLDLSRNNITHQGAESLAQLLQHDDKRGGCYFEDMEELILAGNPIGPVGVKAIGTSLANKRSSKENTRLKTLDLSTTDCGVEGAIAMLTCSSLERLRLFNNKLGESFGELEQHLQGGHMTLKELDLGGNGGSQEAVMGILRAICEPSQEDSLEGKSSSALCVLELGGNGASIGIEEFIATAVKEKHPRLDVARDKPRRS